MSELPNSALVQTASRPAARSSLTPPPPAATVTTGSPSPRPVSTSTARTICWRRRGTAVDFFNGLGALLAMYGSVNDRVRAIYDERLEILTGADGTLVSAAREPPSGWERLTQIDAQLSRLLRRHRLLHNAVLLIYAGVAVLVLSVITIGIAVTASSGAAGTAALVLVLAGTVMLLGGLPFAARSIIISTDALDYEVQRTLSLGS
jgi:hypothetical protein